MLTAVLLFERFDYMLCSGVINLQLERSIFNSYLLLVDQIHELVALVLVHGDVTPLGLGHHGAELGFCATGLAFLGVSFLGLLAS